MFGHRYFGARYFGPAYWGDGGDTPPPAPVTDEWGSRGGIDFHRWDTSRRRSRREEHEGLREEIIALYEGIKAAPVPAVVAPIVARLEEIRAVPVRRRERTSLPAVAAVDWSKVIADAVAVELLRQWDELLREDEQILLMGD